jgi:hypothetical protein
MQLQERQSFSRFQISSIAHYQSEVRLSEAKSFDKPNNTNIYLTHMLRTKITLVEMKEITIWSS